MIEVRVPGDLIRNIENELLKVATFKSKLQEAGIPVLGGLIAWDVERGSLVATRDDVFDEFVYTWFDSNEKVSL